MNGLVGMLNYLVYREAALKARILFLHHTAYRTVYAVKLGEDIWVVHAFQKKSTKGIKTPKREVDLIRSRISQLKEQLR